MKTVQVSKRGCGYPKEGGFYAIGGGVAMHCHALPMTLVPCSCCMQMPKQTRAPVRTTSEYLHQLAEECEISSKCRFCIQDNKTYWVSWIGSDYTAESFEMEVKKQGLSRKIPPSLAKLIATGDLFVNVKNGKIISIVPISTVRYYVKPSDKPDTLKELENDGIEVCTFEKIPEPKQAKLQL